MDKLISVVIPCYNVEAYIDRCVNSLVNQTIGIDSLELIFVDDCSPDNTWEHLLAWEERYPDSIILIQHEENKKQGGARNTGMSYASAPFIGFVDSDDWVEPTMYQKLYEKAVEYQCDLTGCRQRRVYGSYEKLGRTGKEDSYLTFDTIEKKKNLFIDGIFGGVYCRIYKRELIFDNQVWFPEHMVYEDNYWMDILKVYVKSYYIIEEELYHYFINRSSVITDRHAKTHADRLKAEIMTIDKYKELGILDCYYREIEYRFMKLYYINTLFVMISRCNDFSAELMHTMQATALEYFPDYSQNPYLIRCLNDIEKVLLSTLTHTYTQEKIEQLIYVFRKHYK